MAHLMELDTKVLLIDGKLKPEFFKFVEFLSTPVRFPHTDSGERTGLVVRALDSGSGDPGSILGRVGVLFP